MSRNALALFDTDSRNQVFQFIKVAIDRKVSKNEMVSPYDDQLIGKMNFSMGTDEKSMFFTYARASEYHGMRFKHHKVVYASMDVSENSSKALQQICTQFGGFFIADDEESTEWVKIEAAPTVEEELLNVVEEEDQPETEELPEDDEEFYEEKESFSIAKEDLQRNSRKNKAVRYSDDIESYVLESHSEEEQKQGDNNGENRKNNGDKPKDGERNGKNRNHYSRNRNRNGGNGENRSQENKNPDGRGQDGKQPERQERPPKQDNGNGESGEGGNSNNNHRRRRHHHRNNRPKGEGGQSAPRPEV